MNRFRSRSLLLILGGAILWIVSADSNAAPNPVQTLRVQQVGDNHYFHVRLRLPPDIVAEMNQFDRFGRDWWEAPAPNLAPRLVDAEGRLRVVCQRRGDNRFGGARDVPKSFLDKDRPFKDGSFKDDTFKDGPGPVRGGPVPVEGLEFIGRYDPRGGEVKARLLYPVPGRPLPFLGGLRRQNPAPVWREMEVTLDFARGNVIPVPQEANERKKQEPVIRVTDREGFRDGRFGKDLPFKEGPPRAFLKDDSYKDAPNKDFRKDDRYKDSTAKDVPIRDFRKDSVKDAPDKDFRKDNFRKDDARKDAPFKNPTPRPRTQPHDPPVAEDLEGLWAIAQVQQFNQLAGEVRNFAFYRFAVEATARKYRVQVQPGLFGFDWDRNQSWDPDWMPEFGPGSRGGPFDRDLYNLTTGATAITESLQMRRMARMRADVDEERSVPIASIPGIEVAEHPWEKMLGGKKPAAEPLANMIPHDNYYITFRDPARMLEFASLLEQWGGNINRAFEFTSRNYRLWDRYEQQLGLKTSALAKNLGSLGIKGISITGNDAYLQDGTDLTLLLQAADAKGLVVALEPMLAEARKKFGAALKESKSEHEGTTIESFVTPRREVSLHRAILGNVVLLSNSSVALKRVLDTAQGRGKRLADSLDFQYMRVVFRADDRAEDGFLYLPDAFIRNFVGPASRIKQKRRLEALVSLHTLTHAAMLAAWDSGKAPNSTPNLLTQAGLRGDEIPVPDGKPAAWDSEALTAVSEVYGTIHFGTPLVELDISQVTPKEAEEYRRFRLEYLGLWRQFFDPIGMRLGMTDGQVKLETYILPLIENSAYNALRRITGSGSMKYDPAAISTGTLAQYMMHLSTDANERLRWFGPVGPGGPGFNRPPAADLGFAGLALWALEPLGEWFLLRIDESPNYERLVRMAESGARGDPVDIEEVARLVWTLPVAAGVDVKNPMTVATLLTTLRTSAMMSLPGGITWGPLEKDHEGVPIVKVAATPAGRRMMGPLGPGGPGPFRREPFLPALYYAMIDGGLYVTLNEDMMRQLIGTAKARREGKGELVESATSLYLSPGAAERSKDLIKRAVEIQTNQSARTALPIWYALYRSSVVPADARPEAAADAAYRYLGYVPTSPDGTAFQFDRAHDEVVSERHGSLRKPALAKTTAENAPFNQLLESLKSIRTDLRFREDGIQTTITMKRTGAGNSK